MLRVPFDTVQPYVRTARMRVWLRVDVGTGAHPSRRRLTTSAAAGEDC